MHALPSFRQYRLHDGMEVMRAITVALTGRSCAIVASL